MKHYRPYRFPALRQAVPAAVRQSGRVEEWQASRDEGFRQGLDEGYQEGHRSGFENGRAEGQAEGCRLGLQQSREQAREEMQAAFDAAMRPVEALHQRLEQLRADYQSAQRKEVIELVRRIARQVIRCELTLQPVQLLALVDETLAAMPPVADGGVEVFLNPEDLRRIRDIDPKRFRNWTLLADARLESGECRVKAGDQEVDAGCNQRLAACMTQVSAQLLEPAEPAPALQHREEPAEAGT